jgi:acyl-CoA dehydrogenase
MTASTQEELAALAAAVKEVLGDHCTPERLAAAEGDTDLVLWKQLHDAGFTRVGIPEESGGSGGGLADVAAMLRVAGAYAAPVPLAEATLLAGWLLAEAGLPQPDGLATTGQCEVEVEQVADGWRLAGTVRRVPGVQHADVVVVLASPKKPDEGVSSGECVVVAVPPGDCQVTPGHNLAGEPRDDVALDLVVASAAKVPARLTDELRLRGALSRSILSDGALEHVQRLTIRYAAERQQFGRSLSAFQAVQQSLALLAGEAAAAKAAVGGAVDACNRSGFGDAAAAFSVAAAKVRTAQAGSTAAAIAHQVHGALGMTREHPLRFSTTRLWAWRSEWGSEAQWSELLGQQAVDAGADGVWPLLVGA